MVVLGTVGNASRIPPNGESYISSGVNILNTNEPVLFRCNIELDGSNMVTVFTITVSQISILKIGRDVSLGGPKRGHIGCIVDCNRNPNRLFRRCTY